MAKVDLSKMGNLLSSKGQVVAPAADAIQRASKDDDDKGQKDDIVNLSFKVPSYFRKRFKLAAVHAGITQNQLIQETLAIWEKSRN